ncbi:hypothetical protein AK812_SmicGene34812 [Symbiodinium microadriaticum]|uniref:Uncharacterized protein n=1 Tax=Symbiodinium microadriaticum TaxID=2951 RepID=A0A1Q9CN22_SYMMI|nr:hypothetical protein AK812_SmicGene34812 [Symbiodinium microadriaticum]
MDSPLAFRIQNASFQILDPKFPDQAKVWAGGHGHEHLAVVRVFSTDDEVMLLNMSKMGWDEIVPCSSKSNMSAIDLILVYSKDLTGNSMANQVVMDMVNGFQMKMDMEMYGSTNVTMGTMYDWMECFSAIKSMSAMLNPEQDVYDSNGYTTNKHWVSGPNHVFKKILDAMYMGEYMDMYDSFFLMEMDAVPIKDNWLDQFEMEAHEVHDNDQAVRGSQYLGDKWDLFKHMMPVYLVEHINGNAIYNLKNSWTKYLYQAFTMAGDASMMEEMAFDVAFAPWHREQTSVSAPTRAMMTMAAESGDPMYAANWTGNNMTYNTHTMLVGNYVRDSGSDDEVTLGVAYFDHQGHFMETAGAQVPTHHPFKKILGITYFDQPNSTMTISAPGGDVTMMMQPAMYALTDNYHIVKAPVSVLMDDEMLGLMYCGERPNCKASMEQVKILPLGRAFRATVRRSVEFEAEDLFSINLNYHHDKYEVLYKTVLDDYIAWKISSPNYNIADEFTPKDKTRYGWRAWTSLWNPAPVDDRNCDTTLYGVKEYLETLGNISTCAVDYVARLLTDLLQSGYVLSSIGHLGAVYSVLEAVVELSVEDADAVMNDAWTSLRSGFATLMDVPVEKVMLEFMTSRRLADGNMRRRLAEMLTAIFTVELDSVSDAEETLGWQKQVEFETKSVSMVSEEAGFSGMVQAPTTTTTTTTVQHQDLTRASVVP